MIQKTQHIYKLRDFLALKKEIVLNSLYAVYQPSFFSAILKNYPVGNIVLGAMKDGKYIVLDGKRRLKALFDAIETKNLFYDIEHDEFSYNIPTNRTIFVADMFESTAFLRWEENCMDEKIISQMRAACDQLLNYEITVQVITNITNEEAEQIRSFLNIQW